MWVGLGAQLEGAMSEGNGGKVAGKYLSHKA